VMIFLMMGRDMRAMEPTEPLFWGVMSLGVIVGFATAYPVNVWMVSKNLKHGLMHVEVPSGSVLEPGTPAEPAPAGAAAPAHGSHGGPHGHGSHQMGGS
jgi:manganese oxidase